MKQAPIIHSPNAHQAILTPAQQVGGPHEAEGGDGALVVEELSDLGSFSQVVHADMFVHPARHEEEAGLGAFPGDGEGTDGALVGGVGEGLREEEEEEGGLGGEESEGGDREPLFTSHHRRE